MGDILVNVGFDVGSSSPIDSRTVKNTTDERDALVYAGKVYENLKVYCKDTQKEYRWTGTEWEISSSSSGTDISMTDYYTKTEVDNDFLKKTDAASIYATKTELNEKANDDEVVKKADITDLENRVTTNEADITGLQEQTSDLQEQIDNLDIPEDVDFTGINDRLTQLENTVNLKKDVPKTTLTPEFPGEARVASGGVAINYVVKNGWCNVNFEFNLASATTFPWTRIASGLPKPANNANILLTDETGKLNRTIAIKITSTGSVSSRIPVAFTANDWWTGNISYPVAES